MLGRVEVEVEVEGMVPAVVALAMSPLLNAVDPPRSLISTPDQTSWSHSPVVSLIVLEFRHRTDGAVAVAVDWPCIERKV